MFQVQVHSAFDGYYQLLVETYNYSYDHARHKMCV